MLQEYTSILSPAALHFVAELHRRFEKTRSHLLFRREQRQLSLNQVCGPRVVLLNVWFKCEGRKYNNCSNDIQGVFPDFLAETEWIRTSSWKCAPTPADLQDRRVEITGPPIRKMLINAMNCGATGFMVDFEDASMYIASHSYHY